MTDAAVATPQAIPTQPSDVLMEFILGIIAPLLMSGCASDIGLARLAALETISAYKARGQDDLVTIAQFLGFVLAALDNLRLSTAEVLSVTAKLRLRGNANALNRNARHATTTLGQRPPAEPPPRTAEREEPAAPVRPAPVRPVTVRPQPAPTAAAPPPAEPEDQWRGLWAGAMTDVAAEFSAGLEKLPATQRAAELIRISALTDAAATIKGGPRNASYRERLLAGTALRDTTGPINAQAEKAAAQSPKGANGHAPAEARPPPSK